MIVETVERPAVADRAILKDTGNAMPLAGDPGIEAQLRQGDVYLYPVRVIPAGLVPLVEPEGGYALMLPTAKRPHPSHIIASGTSVVIGYAAAEGHPVGFLAVQGAFAVLRHHDHADPEKHGDVLVPQGFWRVHRQQRYVATENSAVVAFQAAFD
jgi:hypothetical protein